MNENNVKTELMKAKEKYKAKKYEDAVDIYTTYYDSYLDEFTKWDNIFYAWSLYYSKIKNSKSLEELVENVERITELVSQIDASKKSSACPYSLAIIEVMKNYSLKNKFGKVIQWAEKLDPDLLSKKSGESNGIRYASNREKWYFYVSKALLKVDEYEDAIFISKEALKDLDDFNGDNEIWFKYRIAQANKELGNFDEALKYLNEIIDYKPEWYVQYEMADNYFFKNDFDKSLDYAIKAALNKGSVEMKTNLYSLISDLLEDKGMDKDANNHLYFIYALKKERDYAIDESLKEQLKKEGYDLENTNSNKIEKELTMFWEDLKYSNLSPYTGVIVNILPNGKAGFIKPDSGGENYYFSVYDFKDDNNLLKIGNKVSFFLEDGFDKKKNKKTKNAVNIKLIN